MKHATSPFVVYIITKLELGGAQKVCLSLFEQIQKKDPNRAALISGQEGVLVEEVKKNNNVFLLPDFKREVTLSGIIDELKAFYALMRRLYLLKKKYIHVIVHTHSTKAGLLGRWAAFLVRIPHRIHTVHGFGFHQHQSRCAWYVNYFCELLTSFITTQYICVAKTDIVTGIKHIPFFKQKHTLIRAAATIPIASHKKVQVTNTAHNTHIFGTISCFKKQKNIFDLLQAFAYCYQYNQQCRLEIIGDGILRPAIELWIQSNQLHHVITLHGWQSDVTPFLRTWHTFVLTSLWEGLPCAVVEARLHKLPVIAYNVGGISEIIQHNKNGFLCNPKDVHAVSTHMHMLSTNLTVWGRMALYHDTLNSFSSRHMHRRHEKLYRTMI
ncbi:MAG: glycosyltransferase [Candidatus Babeliales bacterium]